MSEDHPLRPSIGSPIVSMDSNDDDPNDIFPEADEVLGQLGDDVTPNLGTPVSEPALWTPAEGWGTVRDYVVVRNDAGGTDVGCCFIPDDGSQPVPLVRHNVNEGAVPLKGLGEFARGVLTGSRNDCHLEIKITPEGMAKVEKLIRGINALETVKRAMMQRRYGPFYQTCGYGHDSSWRLVKAAPGLLPRISG